MYLNVYFGKNTAIALKAGYFEALTLCFCVLVFFFFILCFGSRLEQHFKISVVRNQFARKLSIVWNLDLLLMSFVTANEQQLKMQICTNDFKSELNSYKD